MKISAIEKEYFNHLITHALTLDHYCNDLKGFHGINTTEERKALFPSETELRNMRLADAELTDKQWQDFWNIIEATEIDIAKSEVADDKRTIEDTAYNQECPIKYDKDGHAYRLVKDYMDIGG